MIDETPLFRDSAIKAQTPKTKERVVEEAKTKVRVTGRGLLTKETALSRIKSQVPFPLVEEETKDKIALLSEKWKLLTNPEQFDALLQIVLWLDWPKTIDNETTVLVWETQDMLKLVTTSLYGFLYGKSRHLLSLLKIQEVHYRPLENKKSRTVLNLFFEEPSPHHQRTILQVIKGSSFLTKEKESILQLTSSTFYECLVKACLASLLCSYKLSRTDLQEEEVEIYYLQGLGDSQWQQQFLYDILVPIYEYQSLGPRFTRKRQQTQSSTNFLGLDVGNILPLSSLTELEAQEEKLREQVRKQLSETTLHDY